LEKTMSRLRLLFQQNQQKTFEQLPLLGRSQFLNTWAGTGVAPVR
jgi:hypothetical protein